jgi:carboxyl-terminal processing protease
MNDLDRDDWFSVYINSITSGYDPHTNYFAPEEKNVLMLASVVKGIGARLKKMTLPKYLNLFQEVRLGAEQLEAGDLIMKVAQGNGVPVDVVGMRLMM